jgi:hypothetical protein
MTILTDETQLYAYLGFGYVPTVHKPDPFYLLGEVCPSGTLESRSPDELIEQGTHLFRNSIRKIAEAQPAGKANVVMLSGGLDSRAILAGLLENFDAGNIDACTYGYPGNDDYEMAAQIARATGVRHYQLNLLGFNWTTQDLLDSARLRSSPQSFVVGARYFYHKLYIQFGKDSVFWDGLMGGTLSGVHIPSQPVDDWEEAVQKFIKSNRVASPAGLVPINFDLRSVLPKSPLCGQETMTYIDQLDVAFRQTCYIHNRIPKGFQTETPYTDNEWANFILHVPWQWRKDQLLYRQILLRAYPKLFSLPVSGSRGANAGSSWRPQRHRKLIGQARSFAKRAFPKWRAVNVAHDINSKVGQEMRDNPSLRSVVTENLAALRHRKLLDWVDLDALWKQHLTQEKDHTTVLRVLLSLEITLKLEEMELQQSLSR